VSTKRERLIARLAKKEAALEKAYVALEAITESQLEAYKFSDMTGRQESDNLKIKDLNELIEKLEKEIDSINARLSASNVVYQRLRR
jgi:hypothetical protein